jgi:hypothetical protein
MIIRNKSINQYDKRNIHMYNYPNMIYIPSSNCSAPCSPRPSLHFTTHIDTSFPFNFTLFHFSPSRLVLPLLNFLPPHYTSRHHTSLHFTSLHFYTIFATLHFTPFMIAFLTAAKSWKLGTEIVFSVNVQKCLASILLRVLRKWLRWEV